MKSFKTVLEDVYTSEYKIKQWVDPVTGKTKERKVRPKRIDFAASQLRGEPAKKDMKEETMNEQATVKTQKYSWGTMKTVHHGSSFSIPLHPEHHEAIAKLKDEQEHKFKDETGRHWTARRKGDDVHLHSANDGPKTVVKHSDLKEETKPSKDEVSHAPVAPTIPRKYIRGTPEHKAYKASKQKSNLGFPTGKYNEEAESVEEQLLEVLSKDAAAGEWISDFVKSDNPKFAGKSKKERIKMALGAYYGKQNEEVELDEAFDPSEIAGNPRMYSADSAKKAYYHKNASASDKESLAKHLDRYHGNKEWRKPVKEEAEQIDEKSEQARRNKTMKNMMDASRGARYKLKNPVPDAEPEHKTAQAHNKAIGRALRSEGVNDRPKSTEVKSTTALAPMGKTTTGATMKDSSGVAHSTMSRARRLARLALGKKTTNEAKEQYKGLEKEDKKGLPTAIIKKSEKAVEGDTVEGWDHPHDAVKEEVQKVDVPAYLRKAKGEKPLELKDLKRKDTISGSEDLKRNTSGVKEELKGDQHKLDKNKNGKLDKHDFKLLRKEGKQLSYSQFAALLEYEVDKNGKYVHKGNYGSSYAKAEREKDEAGFESEPATAKRGPKMGSKRGARANYGSSKLHTK